MFCLLGSLLLLLLTIPLSTCKVASVVVVEANAVIAASSRCCLIMELRCCSFFLRASAIADFDDEEEEYDDGFFVLLLLLLLLLLFFLDMEDDCVVDEDDLDVDVNLRCFCFLVEETKSFWICCFTISFGVIVNNDVDSSYDKNLPPPLSLVPSQTDSIIVCTIDSCSIVLCLWYVKAGRYISNNSLYVPLPLKFIDVISLEFVLLNRFFVFFDPNNSNSKTSDC